MVNVQYKIFCYQLYKYAPKTRLRKQSLTLSLINLCEDLAQGLKSTNGKEYSSLACPFPNVYTQSSSPYLCVISKFSVICAFYQPSIEC